MTQHVAGDATPGTVVEFFESREILCGVCTAFRGGRLAVLTQQNREMNLSANRILHSGPQLDIRLGRDSLVQRLGTISEQRRQLASGINLEELWSLLEEETEFLTPADLAAFIFTGTLDDHHVAAIQRSLLRDRLYFQGKDGRFLPRTREKMEQRRLEIEREEEREKQLEEGSRWVALLWNKKQRSSLGESHDTIVESLKSYALFGQESPHEAFVKEVFKRAAVQSQPQSAFRILVNLGVWTQNQNLYLLQEGISTEFPESVLDKAEQAAGSAFRAAADGSGLRRDLRSLHAFTIDSAMTRDYDDALSLEVLGDDLYQVGIHIADAAEVIPQGDSVDVEAQSRASSIYLPDENIPMLPPSLSEEACSLRVGKDRLSVSFLIQIDAAGQIHSREVVNSIIRVREQLTYEQVNEAVRTREHLEILHRLSLKLREKRFADGAIVLPLPEIYLHVNKAGMIQLERYEKETPSQIMVSEWMIAANSLAADFLVERGIPAIFRAQAECKQETDFTHSEHELFRVYRKRRLFSRATLDTVPGLHCSLALKNYTTVTSPIRRYSDLVVQRQIKSALNGGPAIYTEEELRALISSLGAAQSRITVIQRRWTRYWILKYIEQEDLQDLDAIVLDQNERFSHLLLPDFLIEANAAKPDKTRLHPGAQPGELIRVKLEKINPREDTLKIQLPELSRQS